MALKNPSYWILVASAFNFLEGAGILAISGDFSVSLFWTLQDNVKNSSQTDVQPPHDFAALRLNFMSAPSFI